MSLQSMYTIGQFQRRDSPLVPVQLSRSFHQSMCTIVLGLATFSLVLVQTSRSFHAMTPLVMVVFSRNTVNTYLSTWKEEERATTTTVGEGAGARRRCVREPLRLGATFRLKTRQAAFSLVYHGVVCSSHLGQINAPVGVRGRLVSPRRVSNTTVSSYP